MLGSIKKNQSTLGKISYGMSLIKKISLVIVSLVAVFSFGSVVLAQENQPAPAKPPLSVEILNVNFDEKTREIKVSASITNNQNTFTGDLQYMLELDKGEALAKEGFLFEPLDFITYGEGKIQSIAPFETIAKEIVYIPNSGIESGKYFFQLIVNNRENTRSGYDYTKEATILSGEGWYVGGLVYTFLYNNEKYFPLEGPLMKSDERAAISITLENNPKLNSKIIAGESYYGSVKIFELTSETPVKEYQKTKLLITKDKEGRNIIKYDLIPWEGIKPSPYTVEMEIFDSNNRKVSETLSVRWWVEGFLARIRDVKTEANYYKAGEKFNLSIPITSLFYSKDQKAIVDLEIETSSGEIIKESRTFLLGNNIIVDFSDMTMAKKGMLKSVSVVLKDEQTGKVFDARNIILPQDKIYRVDDTNLNIYLYVSILLFILIAASIVWYAKKRNKLSLIFLFVFLIAMGITYFMFHLEKANAREDLPDNGWNEIRTFFNYTEAPSGNQGVCPTTGVISVPVTATLSVYCDHCMNGVAGTETVANVSRTVKAKADVPGEKNPRSYEWGPFTGHVSVSKLNPIFSYGASVDLNDGSHCYGGDKTLNSYTISCTVPVVNYTLSVKKSGAGTGTVSGTGISCGSDCSETVETGTSITLDATPSSGSTFGGWSGSCSGNIDCSFVLDTDKTVNAEFSLKNPDAVTDDPDDPDGLNSPDDPDDPDEPIIEPQYGQCGSADKQSYVSSIGLLTSELCRVGEPVHAFFYENGPWPWVCDVTGGTRSGLCIAFKTVTPLDPTLSCDIVMNPDHSKVNVNNQTIWEVSSTPNIADFNSRLKKWTITTDDFNGVSRKEFYSDGENYNSLKYLFTTLGIKTVSVQISSTTPNIWGEPCTASTTIVQTGGYTSEN